MVNGRIGILIGFFLLSAPAWATPYSQVQTFLHNLATQYPQSTRLFVLGQSDAGVPIEGVIIGNGPVENLLVATHHGNEYGSTEVAKGFAADLAKNPIAGQTLFIIPVLNVSGYNGNERRETLGGTTYDPNRNYPGPCGTEGPFTLKSTHALADFMAAHHIVVSATLHTFSPAVLYPWGISTKDLSTAYDDQFKQLGLWATMESTYAVGNSTELLYPADGAFEDYAFWKHGAWSMLFEIGFSHSPTAAEVKTMVEVNVPGLRRMYTQAPTAPAAKHDFTGHCDTHFIGKFDRHDE